MSDSLKFLKNAWHHKGSTHYNIPLENGTFAKVALILEGKKGDKNRPVQSAHVDPPEVAIEEIVCDDPILSGCIACGKEEGDCNICPNNKELTLAIAVAQVLAEVALIVPEFEDTKDEKPKEPGALYYPRKSIEQAVLLGKMPKLERERHEEK